MKTVVSKVITAMFIVTLISIQNVASQSYNTQKTTLVNFISRMYEKEPFEGVKIVEDYDYSYIIVAIMLDTQKYNSDSILNRVASTKAMNELNRFMNGSALSYDMIIRTTDDNKVADNQEIIEHIREQSVGHVQSLEQLTNFPYKKQVGWQVFIFYKQIMQK